MMKIARNESFTCTTSSNPEEDAVLPGILPYHACYIALCPNICVVQCRLQLQ